MKTAVAKLRYLKIAPRKVRSVAGLIRGLPVQSAQAQLMVQPRRAATPLMKLLNSAVANAKNAEMDLAKLYISSLTVDQGPMLKRMLPKARGRGTLLQKIMSHVTLELSEKEGLKAAPFVMPRRIKEEKGKAKQAPKAAEKPKVQHDHAEKPKPKESKGIRAKLFNRKAGEA